MTGGSLSLSSTRGVGQDVINIRPQITFFKKVYKRHTNFGVESILQSDSPPDFGGSSEYKILKTGSLITDMHIEFTLPPAADGPGLPLNFPLNTGAKSAGATPGTGIVSKYNTYAKWVNAVGYAIIKEIQLKFGSTILDKHTGLWYDIWNELTDPNRKEWPLIGKELDTDHSLPNNINNSSTTKSRYFVPLKFYFNRNPGLALPILLLNDNDLRINISLNSLESLLNFDVKYAADKTTIEGNPSITNRGIDKFRFYVNYVFLEPDEESRIQNSLPSEYLVETLDIKDNITSADVSSLVFENPTKEFIWVFRHNNRIESGNTTNKIPEISTKPSNKVRDDDIKSNDIFNYSCINVNSTLGYGTFDPFDSLILKINNKERIEETDATFFRTIQPYKYHSNIPGGYEEQQKKKYIYVYSFALNPEEYQPTGSYNFSLGDDRVSFEFSGETDLATKYDLTIFALKYVYLVFNQGRVSISRVPIQNTLQSITKQSAKTGKKGEKKTMSQQIADTNDKAVKTEIERRYATEVPYLAEQRLGKKTWSGLQGDFFQKQKMDDMGKTIEQKKKDIF